MMEVMVSGVSITFLSGSIWPLAISHCEQAEAEALRPLDEPIDEEMRHATGAIILAATAAEAFINEFILDDRTPIGELEVGRSPYDPGFRPKDKWRAALRHATGDPQVAGRAPLQDFGFLVDLRNLLVHYLPEERILVLSQGIAPPQPSDLEQEEARIEQFIVQRTQLGPRCPNNPFMHRVLCGGTARWAVSTVEDLVHLLCQAAGGAAGPPWFAP